jgi:Ca2+-binding EF-hand superfamily protein
MDDNKAYKKLNAKYSGFPLKSYMKTGLSKEELLQLKEAFDLFDVDQKEYITLHELQDCLNWLGIYSKDGTIEKLINEGKEKMDFEGFVNFFSGKIACKSREEAKKLYYVFLGENDITKDLSVENFARVAQELEINFGEGEIEEMIKSVGTQRDGYVSFDEFYSLMAKQK